MTWNELCDTITRISGIPTRFRRTSPEAFFRARATNAVKAALILEEERYIEICGYYGNQPGTLDAVAIREQYNVEIPTETLEDYLRRDLPAKLPAVYSAWQGSDRATIDSNVRTGAQGDVGTAQVMNA